MEQPEEQDYDETEDDSYMGDADAASDDEEAPQSPSNYTFIQWSLSPATKKPRQYGFFFHIFSLFGKKKTLYICMA